MLSPMLVSVYWLALITHIKLYFYLGNLLMKKHNGTIQNDKLSKIKIGRKEKRTYKDKRSKISSNEK